jgi:hypothetical protein
MEIASEEKGVLPPGVQAVGKEAPGTGLPLLTQALGAKLPDPALVFWLSPERTLLV